MIEKFLNINLSLSEQEISTLEHYCNQLNREPTDVLVEAVHRYLQTLTPATAGPSPAVAPIKTAPKQAQRDWEVAFYQAMRQTLPDLVLRVRRDGSCVSFIPPQGLQTGTFVPIEQHIREVLSPDRLQQQLQCIEQALTTGEVQVYEQPIEKQGNLFYEEVRSSPIDQEEVLLLVRDITQQKQLEADRDRFFTLSLDMLCIADFEGYFQRLNPAWEKTLGYSCEELMAVPYLEFVHPEDRVTTLLEASKLTIGTQTIEFENRYRCRDGSYRWLLWNAMPCLEQGVIYCVAHDITERKQVEAALRRSEERFRSLVSNVPGVIYRCQHDSNWTMEFISDAIQDLCGYAASEFIHNRIRNYTSIIHPEDRDRVDRAIAQALTTQSPFDLEYRILHRDGSLRWVQERGRGVFDAAGTVLYLDGVIFDITERNQVEDALRLAEANYRSIFENALGGIFQSTPEGRYLRVNPAMAQIHGYESPEHMVAMVQDIGQQIYAQAGCREEFKRLLATTDEVKGFQYPIVRSDGCQIWLEEHTRAVRDASGQLLYYEGIVEDITQRKREEEALKYQVQTLRIEIDQHRRKQEVTGIMQTDYFQALQAEANYLRFQD